MSQPPAAPDAAPDVIVGGFETPASEAGPSPTPAGGLEIRAPKGGSPAASTDPNTPGDGVGTPGKSAIRPGISRQLSNYAVKWRGAKKNSPPVSPIMELVWAWLGSFAGIVILGALQYNYSEVSKESYSMLIGSFGASAVLLYGVPNAPLAQPRNLVGGHILSAVVGVAIRKLIVELPGWDAGLGLAGALAVAFATTLMMATGTTHPPGAATALIAVTGDHTIVNLGFMYVLVPVTVGSLIMLLVAMVVNNLAPTRHYPQWWW